MEYLKSIETLMDLARKELLRKDEIESVTETIYFYVRKDNTVGNVSNISRIPINDISYIFIILKGVYWYDRKTRYADFYELVSILDSTKICEKIRLSNWTFETINFETEYGFPRHKTKPKFLFALNDDSTKSISYEIGIYGFETAWNFFTELDENCTNLEEAELYKKYYELKREKENLNLSYQELHAHLKSKNKLIEDYKDLLNKIEGLVNA